MAYYECLSNNDCIDNSDSFTVKLTGSHNITITATVCYIDKTTVCLIGDTCLGYINWSTACSYAWNYNVNINNKNYTGLCRIPTLEQLCSKCAGYKRGFHYWTSTQFNESGFWAVHNEGVMIADWPTDNHGIVPFIEITL